MPDVGLAANMLIGKVAENSQKQLVEKLVSSGISKNKAVNIAAEMINTALNNIEKGSETADFSHYGEGVTEIYSAFVNGEYSGETLLRLAKTILVNQNNVDSASSNGYTENIGDETNGYSNTELLAGREVSTSDRSSNGLRQQSENSRKLSSFVGNAKQVSQREGGAVLRAGDSGWLVRQPQTNSEQNSARFNQSLRREISGVELNGRDTAGRTLGAELLEKLKDTIFKDKDGSILSLYHWTKEVFETFSKGEFGFHFGTLDAARDRYLQSKEDYPETPNGIYKEVYLNISNPLYIPFDTDGWSSAPILYQLRENGEISNEEHNRTSELNGLYEPSYDNPAAVATRELLKQKGYDGIIYYNESENQGSLSVIALYPDQIITVAENGVLKEGIGVLEGTSESSAFSEPDISNPKETALSSMQRVVSGGRRITTEEQQKLQAIGRKLGVRVDFDYEGPGNGYYEKGVIHLNPENCKSPLKFIFKHELMHHLENSRLYDKFQKYLFEKSSKFNDWLQTKGTTLTGYRNEVRARYKNAGLTDTLIKNGGGSEIVGANYEIVADFVGETLFGSNEGDITTEFLSELQKENRNIFERIADWFKSVIARLKGTAVEKDLIKLQQKVLRLKETVTTEEANKGKQFDILFPGESKRKRKTTYNEYNTNVLSWAHSSATNPGDIRIFNRNGRNFVLVEATSDSYIELKSGSYKEMKAYYEQAIKRADNQFYVYSDKIRAEGRGGLRDSFANRPRGYSDRNAGQVGGKGLQTDSTGNSEYLWASNQGTSLKDKQFSLERNTTTKADLKESAFSMPEKGKQYSVASETRLEEQRRGLLERAASGEITYDEAMQEYGKLIALPKGENPKVDVTVPEKVGGRYVHRFDRTLLESGHASEEVSEAVAKEIMEGARTFDRISNKSLIREAKALIDKDPQKAVEDWVGAINSDKTLTDRQLVLGQQLMLQAVEENNTKNKPCGKMPQGLFLFSHSNKI